MPQDTAPYMQLDLPLRVRLERAEAMLQPLAIADNVHSTTVIRWHYKAIFNTRSAAWCNGLFEDTLWEWLNNCYPVQEE